MRINGDTLFMRYPSSWWHDLWREGLAAGNGEIGVNVYGGVKEETTMLTHHDLWHNGFEDELPDVSDAFARQRRLMQEERFQEASWEVVNELKRHNFHTKLQSQLPVMDLQLQIKPNQGFEDYVRGIYMDTGEAGCEWTDSPAKRSSWVFASRQDQVVVKRVTSSLPDLNLLISVDLHRNGKSPHTAAVAQHVLDSKKTVYEENHICYTAQNDDGTCYGAVVRLCPRDGHVQLVPQGIRVTECSELLLLTAVFIREQPENLSAAIDQCKEKLDKLPPDYDSLLASHRKLHQKWYASAALSLQHRGKYHCNEDLLAMAYAGKQPPELIEKLWKFGRYLFICGTSEHSNPFPLYGLWAGEYDLMWSHNMANENTQMIYWHSYAGNLLPFQKGLYQYYNDRIPTYQNNAKKLFGMRGLYMTAGTTPGVSAPNQVVPVIMNWVGAAGWIAQHYCSYYSYTRDEAYLQTHLLPYLLEVAAFYEDFVTFYPDGSICFYPSVSPENTPGNFMPPEHIQMAHPMPTTVNSTIDLAILREFFTNLCEIAESHGICQDRMPLWKKILSSIPEYRVSKDGGIREWQDDRFQERYDHRHLSHIYPVFPGFEVNSLHNRELLPAFRRAVELREIDAQTGWSMAHMAAIHARLENGEAAMQCLNQMAKSSLSANFFSLHNDWRGMNISLNMDPAPVQLDAVLGYVNAVQEMLLYSSGDLVKLLPALSPALSKGSIRSFRYRDGYVTMRWSVEKQRFFAELKAVRAHAFCLQLPKEFSGYRIAGRQATARMADEAGSAAEGMVQVSMEKDGVLTIQV